MKMFAIKTNEFLKGNIPKLLHTFFVTFPTFKGSFLTVIDYIPFKFTETASLLCVVFNIQR